MKKLFIISILSCSFLISKGQITTEVKEWCLAVNEQNKDLKTKSIYKDSTIHAQGVALASKERQNLSYQRDSVSWYTTDQAHQLMFGNYETFIGVQRKEIRKLKGKNTSLFGILIIGAGLAIYDHFHNNEK